MSKKIDDDCKFSFFFGIRIWTVVFSLLFNLIFSVGFSAHAQMSSDGRDSTATFFGGLSDMSAYCGNFGTGHSSTASAQSLNDFGNTVNSLEGGTSLSQMSSEARGTVFSTGSGSLEIGTCDLFTINAINLILGIITDILSVSLLTDPLFCEDTNTLLFTGISFLLNLAAFGLEIGSYLHVKDNVMRSALAKKNPTQLEGLYILRGIISESKNLNVYYLISTALSTAADVGQFIYMLLQIYRPDCQLPKPPSPENFDLTDIAPKKDTKLNQGRDMAIKDVDGRSPGDNVNPVSPVSGKLETRGKTNSNNEEKQTDISMDVIGFLSANWCPIALMALKGLFIFGNHDYDYDRGSDALAAAYHSQTDSKAGSGMYGGNIFYWANWLLLISGDMVCTMVTLDNNDNKYVPRDSPITSSLLSEAMENFEIPTNLLVNILLKSINIAFDAVYLKYYALLVDLYQSRINAIDDVISNLERVSLNRNFKDTSTFYNLLNLIISNSFAMTKGTQKLSPSNSLFSENLCLMKGRVMPCESCSKGNCKKITPNLITHKILPLTSKLGQKGHRTEKALDMFKNLNIFQSENNLPEINNLIFNALKEIEYNKNLLLKSKAAKLTFKKSKMSKKEKSMFKGLVNFSPLKFYKNNTKSLERTFQKMKNKAKLDIKKLAIKGNYSKSELMSIISNPIDKKKNMVSEPNKINKNDPTKLTSPMSDKGKSIKSISTAPIYLEKRYKINTINKRVHKDIFKILTNRYKIIYYKDLLQE